MPAASESSTSMWFVLFSIGVHGHQLEGGRFCQKIWVSGFSRESHQFRHTAEGQRLASGTIPGAEWQGWSLGWESSLNAMGTQPFLNLSETKAGTLIPRQ